MNFFMFCSRLCSAGHSAWTQLFSRKDRKAAKPALRRPLKASKSEANSLRLCDSARCLDQASYEFAEIKLASEHCLCAFAPLREILDQASRDNQLLFSRKDRKAAKPA